jgi:hypothetical protein
LLCVVLGDSVFINSLSFLSSYMAAKEKRFVNYLVTNSSCVIVTFGKDGSGSGGPWLTLWCMSDSRLEEVNKFSRLSEYPASDQEFLTLVVLDERNKC